MPYRFTLSQMVAEVRSRRLSPVELVESHLRHIEQYNPKINAFVRVLGDGGGFRAISGDKLA